MATKTLSATKKYSIFNYNKSNSAMYTTTGLVQYFDAYVNQPNSTVWVDAQGSSNLAFVNAPTVSTSGASNNYYVTFNGSTQYATGLQTLNLPTFSFYMWVKTTATAGNNATNYTQPPLVGVITSGIGSRDYSITIGGGWLGNFSGLSGVDTGNQINDAPRYNYISDNVWHEVVGTVSSTNGSKIFFDRTQIGTSISVTKNTDPTNSMNLGRSGGGQNYYANFSTAVVMLYNTELSNTQILTNYNYFKSRKYV